MATRSSSTHVVTHVEPLFTDAERIALAGFLAAYSGLTRDAHAIDLRQIHDLVASSTDRTERPRLDTSDGTVCAAYGDSASHA